MNRNTLLAAFIALAIGPGLGGLCRAQDAGDIPVLKQYDGRDWIYFAPATDETLIFENQPHGASNVWVAAEWSPINPRILSKTDAWTDSQGRPHTVGILKLQLEFNAYVKTQRALGPPYVADTVRETGILDFSTLTIPHTKLEHRARRIGIRLEEEDAAAERLATTDPNATAIKKKYIAYLREKIEAAISLIRELHDALLAVPTAEAGAEATILRTEAADLLGLRGLEIPRNEPNSLRLVSDDSRSIRLVTTRPLLQAELFVRDFIDPIKMTPAIAENLQEKTAMAEKAVISAEFACNNLLTPPCP